MSKKVYFSGCAVSLERLGDNGRWDYVWSPLCLLSAPAEGVIQGVAISGGTTLHASIAIRTYSNETEWPSTGLPGAYRLRIYLVPEWSSRRVARYLQENWQPTTTNEFSLVPN